MGSPSPIMMQYALPLLALTTSVKTQNSISSCPIDSECIPIKTCAPIISQLSLAKETSDIEKKRMIISQVREKVCGDRRDRLICCPQATPDVVGRSPVKIGTFRNIYHDIGGVAYALDEQNILIKDFTYEGEHFSYSDKNIPLLLRPFDGSEDVVLTLPPGYSTTDLKWLSVWCRDYQINFGHVTFPQELVL